MSATGGDGELVTVLPNPYRYGIISPATQARIPESLRRVVFLKLSLLLGMGLTGPSASSMLSYTT
jgi:hypothetical protein